jgi:hypothetical protein
MSWMWRMVVVTFFLSLSLVSTSRVVNAQICSGTVGVECGSRVCLDGTFEACNEWGCGGGVGWEQVLECSAPYGQCKVDNVCAQAGMCQYSIHGQCTSSGGGEETR